MRRLWLLGAAGAILLMAQVSSVMPIGTILPTFGGRLIFASDSPLLVRDTGKDLEYYCCVARRTPPGNVGTNGWSWSNQGSATATYAGGRLTMSIPAVANSESLVTIKKTAPGTPYEANAVFSFAGGTSPVSGLTYGWDVFGGIVFRESSSNKQTTCQYENDSDGWFFSATYWSTPTGGPGTADQVIDYYRVAKTNSEVRIRAGDDGTNRYCDGSIDDGAHWIRFHQQSRTTNMTADQVGWAAINFQGNNTATLKVSLLHWSGV